MSDNGLLFYSKPLSGGLMPMKKPKQIAYQYNNKEYKRVLPSSIGFGRGAYVRNKFEIKTSSASVFISGLATGLFLAVLINIFFRMV